jgi:hypothetical protein
MKHKKLLFGAMAIIQSAAISAQAAQIQEAEASLGAHVHGELVIQLAQDGQRLTLALDSPAINIVGFESAPGSQEQREKVSAAMALLKSADKVFQLEVAGGSCAVMESRVATGLNATRPDEDDHDHDHEETHHDDDSKTAEHEDHAEHEAEHASFNAEYGLRCDTSAVVIKSLNLRLFESFPGIDRIEVQWVLEQGQGTADLTASSSVLTF